MRKIMIDGSFVGKNVTGVQRFNWEVLKQLVKYKDINWSIAISEDIDKTKLDGIDNLTIIQKGKKNNKFWQFFTLGKLAKKNHADLLCMSNFTPLFKKDYIVLHDVTYLDKTVKNKKLWRLAYQLFVKFHFKKHKHIFTVSNFSKERIKYHYKVNDDKITVVGSAADHWADIEAKKPANINFENFFLSVGSTTPNKNFQYVIELAKKYKDKQFVVVGRIDDKMNELANGLDNVFFTGYMTNEELAWLYKNSNGFILPSLYEGFGLPPLEALYCGCKYLLLSDIQVFKEIYQKAANYLDPYDYKNLIDLDNLKEVSSEERERLLSTYTWHNTAKFIYEDIKKDSKN